MSESRAETLLSILETEQGNCESREVKEVIGIIIRAIKRGIFIAEDKHI